MCSDCRPACVCVPDAVPHKMRWGRRSAVAWSLERLSVWRPGSEGNGRCWDDLASAWWRPQRLWALVVSGPAPEQRTWEYVCQGFGWLLHNINRHYQHWVTLV